MFLDRVQKDSGTRAKIIRAIDDLKLTPFFAALLEAGAERSLLKVSNDYHTGYFDCIRDIEDFETRLATDKPRINVTADFMALRTLLDRGDITKEEYDKLITERRK